MDQNVICKKCKSEIKQAAPKKATNPRPKKAYLLKFNQEIVAIYSSSKKANDAKKAYELEQKVTEIEEMPLK